jgi:hypothetical protein
MLHEDFLVTVIARLDPGNPEKKTGFPGQAGE